VKVTATELPGVLIIEPQVFGDARGSFLETYRASRYREAGIEVDFVQDNLSRSSRGTLRGLHLQHPTGQAKLVSVAQGEVLDVAVDVRRGSPTFGKHVTVVLDSERHNQLFIPRGFAHGFLVRSDEALFTYKCSAPYSPDDELTIAWNDPALAIPWGLPSPLVSDRDAAAVPLEQIDPSRLPRWEAP